MVALGGLLGGGKLGLLLANMDGAAEDYCRLLQSVSKGNGVCCTVHYCSWGKREILA